jgi:hypothetical protein
VSRTTGRSAEVLREGSAIKSTGLRALRSQSAHILTTPGISYRKKTSRPDLSSRQAGQCVLAQGGDYNRTSFLSIRPVTRQRRSWGLSEVTKNQVTICMKKRRNGMVR